tara:strand:+ start:479 stop:1045 length:567 start_codon:yes stop_codon:yes gene_type:complete
MWKIDKLNDVGKLIESHGLDIALSLLIILLGWIISSWFRRILKRFLLRLELDETISVFTAHTLFWLLFAAFMIAAMKQLGIHTTSFVAVLGTAGLTIALSFQKALSNVATGIMLVIFRPFKVGDYVSTSGCEGVVKEISLFNTTIQASDEEIVIVPNTKIMENNVSRFANGKPVVKKPSVSKTKSKKK